MKNQALYFYVGRLKLNLDSSGTFYFSLVNEIRLGRIGALHFDRREAKRAGGAKGAKKEAVR